MAYQYNMPKTHKLFHSQNILYQYENIFNHRYSHQFTMDIINLQRCSVTISWLINTACPKNIPYLKIKIFNNNMKIFLTMHIHTHFTMDIINLLIGFVTIPWVTNTTCPKSITYFTIKIFYSNMKRFLIIYIDHIFCH